MAIYISGVKGLPEQVQANKEDIEQIKEDIENIDFDAIRQLETQVGENTQDINNLEASIGVQNQAINGLGDRLTTAEGKITQIETDTQKITYNATDDETRITGATRILNIKNNRIGDDDSLITFGTANGIELRQGTHIMNYDDDGKLYLDGVEVQPVQPPLPKYVHNITATYSQSSDGYVKIMFTIINDSNELLNTREKIATYLNNNGLNSVNNVLQANGFINFLTQGSLFNVIGIYSNGNTSNNLTFVRVASPITTTTRVDTDNMSFVTSFNDVVIEI